MHLTKSWYSVVPVGAVGGMAFLLFPVPLVNFLLTCLFINHWYLFAVFVKVINLLLFCSPFPVFSEGAYSE